MITQTSNTIIHAGNTSHALPYLIPFRFDHASWLDVTLTPAGAAAPVPLQDGLHYQISTAPGGRRVLHLTEEIPAPGKDDRITITRHAPPVQNLQLTPATSLPEEDLEDALDRLTLAVQDRDLTRDTVFTKPLRFPLGEAVDFTSQPALPDAALRGEGKVITFHPATGLNELGDFNAISAAATAAAYADVDEAGVEEKDALETTLDDLRDALVGTLEPLFFNYRADLGGAFKIQHLGGDNGGNGSLTIQTMRGAGSQVAAGTSATAIGHYSTAAGNQSVAFGHLATSPGVSSTALGQACSASGAQSVAAGQGATASGVDSVALGYGTICQGQQSIAIGEQALARGTHTVAIGRVARTNGLENTAIGSSADSEINTGTILYGYTPYHLGFGTAFGYGAAVQAHGASAIGAGANAMAVMSGAFGYLASASTWETTAISAHAAATATKATATGADALAADPLATAIGSGAQAAHTPATVTATGAAAIGMGSRARADYDTAAGKGATATGTGSAPGGQSATALGHEATATGGGAIAIGTSATATAHRSIAIGHSAATTVADSIDLRATDDENGTAARIFISSTVNAISHTDATPYTDPGIWGYEPAEVLAPGMLTFRINPADTTKLYIDLCLAGTITTYKADLT